MPASRVLTHSQANPGRIATVRTHFKFLNSVSDFRISQHLYLHLAFESIIFALPARGKRLKQAFSLLFFYGRCPTMCRNLENIPLPPAFFSSLQEKSPSPPVIFPSLCGFTAGRERKNSQPLKVNLCVRSVNLRGSAISSARTIIFTLGVSNSIYNSFSKICIYIKGMYYLCRAECSPHL